MSIKLPKTLAACADLYYTTRQERLELDRQADELKKIEAAIKDHLINNLQKDTTGVAGKLCRVQVVIKPEPQVEDWPSFYAYVAKTKSFDLLQRRVSAPAVRERWEANKEIPGISAFQKVDLSIAKV